MRALTMILLVACGPDAPGLPTGPDDTDPVDTDTDVLTDTDDEADTDADADTDTDTDADADADSDSDADADADSDADTDADTDPLGAARATCLDTINQLRATAGKPPFARWTSGEACADASATSDQQTNTPHGNFGGCGEFGQNECLGAGAAGVAGCLQNMWDERLQAGCSGCAACAGAYTQSCPNCDFYGQSTGDVCGHYVNMNAEYFDEVACGFSAAGGWVVINFR